VKQCYFCGKTKAVGSWVSHSHKKSKRNFFPNLFNKSIFLPDSGKEIKVKICADCLKKIGR
jgi:large subunit ribosomal protein L28